MHDDSGTLARFPMRIPGMEKWTEQSDVCCFSYLDKGLKVASESVRIFQAERLGSASTSPQNEDLRYEQTVHDTSERYRKRALGT